MIISWAYLELLVITRTDKLWLVPPNYLFCGWICLHSCVSSLKVGWRGKFLAYQISVSQNLLELNKSSYWACDVVKNTVKSWNSQMNFHSVENRWRKLSQKTSQRSTLLHMRACAMGSQSPTTTLSHFWLLGSKYQREVGSKTKTNTYEFTVLVLTLSLPSNRSEWY